ncbi:EamA family transporter RarD [Arthrobacter sp. I2-34]|uniref:EamA family transporter RarD n=1 Tax=Arthrobacter hankyongi TaxID=2904801 RepID=A0ABS9LAJ4_9MICC|nr:EamA family transporter RarD [Arthrobacter hankyongi]MCG2623685.1 EamA family transporter RarD [Arthrobacter hankyongi]
MHKSGNVRRGGLAIGLATYAIWGFFPLYFILLRGVHPLEILIHRVLWASVVMLGGLALAGQWSSLRHAFMDRWTRRRLCLASVLIGAVWFFYGYGALTGRAVDVALGYFICPLITVTLAVLIQGERLRPTQWISVALGTSAVAVVAIGYGTFPWIACVIAISFGFYSLVKNQVGPDVNAAAGMTIESVFLLPAVGLLFVWMNTTQQTTFMVSAPDSTDLWLILSGPMTVVPLLLFAMAASRLPLSLLGNLQYLNPVLQLLAAVLFLHEAMPPARWAGFVLVWLALMCLVLDAYRVRRPGQKQGNGPSRDRLPTSGRQR